MRTWLILLIKSDLNGVYILVEVSFYIYNDAAHSIGVIYRIVRISF